MERITARVWFPRSRSLNPAIGMFGGLMAYDVNIPDLQRRASIYVDRILMGAKPADLPVEQPAKFEFVINLKIAKALGLTIPSSVLAIADKVITRQSLLLGVKRTSRFLDRVSAYDPKRTLWTSDASPAQTIRLRFQRPPIQSRWLLIDDTSSQLYY
jgi:hypothetical protein